MKRKIIALALAIVFTLSFAGCESSDFTIEGTYASGTITVVNHPIQSMVDGVVKCTGSYPEIRLSDEYQKQYPNLQQTVQYYNNYWESYIRENVADLAYNADSMVKEADYEYEDTVTAQVLRMDNRLLTVLVNEQEYSGGLRQSHWTYGYNIDVAS